jgi:anti-sigma regulatory factor (Ser/Thr protein kinase)
MGSKVGVPAGAGASLRLLVPPEGRNGHYVRERVVGFAASLAVPEADALEFTSAVAEAFVNAVEHSGTEDTIEIACWIVGRDQLFATVIDHGVGFAAGAGAAEPQLPDVMSERGRGLPIMRRYTDVFAVHSSPGAGTAVVLGRKLRRPAGRGTRSPVR